MTRPGRGPESRRYDRYRDAGVDITTQPEKAEKKAEPKNQTDAEKQRQFDKDYNNLNQGLPLHRGSDQETFDAVTKGLHGRDFTDAEIAENADARRREGTASTRTHKGFSKKDQERLTKAARDELEVE